MTLVIITIVSNMAILIIVGWMAHRNRSLNDEVGGWMNATADQLDLRAEERKRHIHDMASAIATIEQLQVDLESATIGRDIRPPTDSIIEYLATHGPTTMAELTENFGPYVGRRLGDLRRDTNVLQCQEDHGLWWVEVDGKVARASQSPQEGPGGPWGHPEAMVIPPEAPERPLMPLTGWVDG